MDVVDLTILIAIAASGILRKAVELLAVDVAKLSRRIARLENDLGVLLFERRRTGVKLTIAGTSTLELARKAIATFDAIRRNALANGRAERGRLRIGTHLSTFGRHLRHPLKAWRDLHPDVDIDLVEVDDRALLAGLREHELSTVICFCPVAPPEISKQRLSTERLLIALPATHPLARADRIGWSEIRELPLLVRSLSGSYAYHNLQARLVGPGADFRPHDAGMFNLLNLVATGEGATFAVNYHREVVIDGVVLRAIDEPDAVIPIELAWDSRAEDPIAGSFGAFMRDRVKNLHEEPFSAVLQTPDRLP